ncbi:SDR family oxidoreductase [soil metagenome]
MAPTPTVLVTGATGYIGGRLVPELLAAGYQVRCLVRTPAKLHDADWGDQVEVLAGDLTDRLSLDRAMAGIGCAYFLVHSMGCAEDFAAQDRKVAASFRDAAAAAGVDRIIYLGGLGDDDDPDLSHHLKSRHEVGRVLSDGPVPVTELRAAVIIGSGSASFEMLRSLVEVLPAMVTPRWVNNRCQPLALRDILVYLVQALEHPEAEGAILEVGGPDVLTYADMMRTYAQVAGLPKRIIQPVPVLSPTLSSHWIGLVTPLPTGLARPLVESLISEVIVDCHPVGEVIDHRPIGFEEALELALRRVNGIEVTTRWSDSALPGRTPADPLPTDPDWSGGRLLVDEQEVTTEAPAEAVFRTVEGIGGDRGWYVTPFLWSARGVIDKLVGGVGMRRGRRHPDRMGVGDAVDFWRVEAVESPSLIRLRAEMRLPGRAWLEWRIDSDDGRTRVRQRALFHPRGLVGRLYWYALVPFHVLIFKRMCQRIVAAAGVEPDHVPTTTSAA